MSDNKQCKQCKVVKHKKHFKGDTCHSCITGVYSPYMVLPFSRGGTGSGPVSPGYGSSSADSSNGSGGIAVSAGVGGSNNI